SLDSEGKVLIRDEPRLLRVTWKVVSVEGLQDAPPGEVEWRLDDLGEVTRLTVSEYGRPPQMAKFNEAARQGWSLILSGLKTLVETGRPMPAIAPESPR
ncbi:MAG TPA: SRPBCC domain-containing protein, partial [Caulobacteraceae bacterium]|nr:SRPBCC domain-containing protein [Caulobacteraceae bacterium]